MKKEVSSSISIKSQSSSIGFSALTNILIAAAPKCPLCWMALMSALGVGSTINSNWLRLLALTLLFLSVSILFVRARRRSGYVPFCLGCIAAIAIYLSKFRLNSDPGVYLSCATLLGVSIWNSLPQRRGPNKIRCRC